jgi:hypothetical protein
MTECPSRYPYPGGLHGHAHLLYQQQLRDAIESGTAEPVPTYGLTQEGQRYILSRGARCENCGRWLIYVDDDAKSRSEYCLTGWCQQCLVSHPSKVREVLKEQAEVSAWLERNALERALVQQAEARRPWPWWRHALNWVRIKLK